MGNPMIVECPECKREAEVFQKQKTFICKDKEGFGFQSDMSRIFGCLHCIDDRWYLVNVEQN